MGTNVKKLKCYLFGSATKEFIWVSVELILDILSSDILGSISSAVSFISAIVHRWNQKLESRRPGSSLVLLLQLST